MPTKTKASLKASQYKLSLKLPDNLYSKQAKTIVEALDNLEIPTYFKGKGIISVQFGKLKSEVWMYPVQLRKLFVNSTSKLLLQKRLLLNLK